jgi:hypothetical protein
MSALRKTIKKDAAKIEGAIEKSRKKKSKVTLKVKKT